MFKSIPCSMTTGLPGYRNPSTGLDSIYQKHVWSRLGTVEPPESSDTDGQAQVRSCLLPHGDIGPRHDCIGAIAWQRAWCSEILLDVPCCLDVSRCSHVRDVHEL